MSVYIHTIDGRPAVFWRGEQICYAENGNRLSALLVPSLRQIRREQAASEAWRRSQGFEPTPYGYLRLRGFKPIA
jgi:hypothetical protein